MARRAAAGKAARTGNARLGGVSRPGWRSRARAERGLDASSLALSRVLGVDGITVDSLARSGPSTHSAIVAARPGGGVVAVQPVGGLPPSIADYGMVFAHPGPLRRTGGRVMPGAGGGGRRGRRAGPVEEGLEARPSRAQGGARLVQGGLDAACADAEAVGQSTRARGTRQIPSADLPPDPASRCGEGRRGRARGVGLDARGHARPVAAVPTGTWPSMRRREQPGPAGGVRGAEEARGPGVGVVPPILRASSEADWPGPACRGSVLRSGRLLGGRAASRHDAFGHRRIGPAGLCPAFRARALQSGGRVPSGGAVRGIGTGAGGGHRREPAMPAVLDGAGG